MKIFEAKYINKYLSDYSDTKITAIAKIAELIESNWKYSSHWNNGGGDDIFLSNIKDAIDLEERKIKKQLDDIYFARNIFNEIEK